MEIFWKDSSASALVLSSVEAASVLVVGVGVERVVTELARAGAKVVKNCLICHFGPDKIS